MTKIVQSSQRLPPHQSKDINLPTDEKPGRTHKDTFRDVKDRIKTRQNSASFSPSVRKTFQLNSLPDVGSSDSEDTKDRQDLSDNENDVFNAVPNHELHSDSAQDIASDSIPSSGDKNQDKGRKSEQTTVSSEGTASSNEVVHFIPRQKYILQQEALSQSQKRAQSWASERLDPIVISPLLVTRKSLPKKTVTPSQKRAKEWANERNFNNDEMFQSKDKSNQENESDANLCQTPPQVTSPQTQFFSTNRVPSPEPTFVGEDESASFTSEDLEVQEITKLQQQRNKLSEIGQRLPMPTEKVELRPTESPIIQPDYEKYRTTAPTVALRKVHTNSQKTVKEAPNFLATVKLRKVSSPAPRIEQDKVGSPCSVSRDGKGKDNSSMAPIDFRQLIDAGICNFNSRKLDLEIMPSDEMSEKLE
jgi:hypothetical protein